jgi:hypothetical protein
MHPPHEEQTPDVMQEGNANSMSMMKAPQKGLQYGQTI